MDSTIEGNMRETIAYWKDLFKEDMEQAEDFIEQTTEMLEECQDDYEYDILHLVDKLGALSGDDLEMFGIVLADVLENEREIRILFANEDPDSFGPETLGQLEAANSTEFYDYCMEYLDEVCK